jgi:hypothetical protein
MTALVWHPVAGRSMWPLGPPLQAGVRYVPVDCLQIGDIIAFIAGHRPVLWVHRVVRFEANGIVTRGDTNGFDDVPVPFAAVLGRVEALRLGPLVLPIAQAGVFAPLQRGAGLGWSRVAPRLRQAWTRQKSRRKTRSDP